MEEQIITILGASWQAGFGAAAAEYVAALEAGMVLYFPQLAFLFNADEQRLLTPDMRDPKSRNISLNADGSLKGAIGEASAQAALAAMMTRFRQQASGLVELLAPRYGEDMRLAPTSYRPASVEGRAQSWRADDRRLHVDAFPSRPNHGERILRVGEPFAAIAERFVPRAKAYSRLQAKLLNTLHVTKSLRSEYDHLMLQIHDGMKADDDYQRSAPQVTMPFAAGSAWICFSDQTAHAVMSGQFMLEQTLHLPAAQQYDQQAHPLAILTRLTGRSLT